ncbi:MAG: RtcB family protein [Dehalococcoidia bacterium]
MARSWREVLRRIDPFRWELPQEYKAGMRVPGLIFASEEMIDEMAGDQAVEQVANVAFLPGIVGRSLAMPDIHWGYGFPIGGVAATRVEDGVISPGGVGFDINCGTRVVGTNLREEEVRPRLADLVNQIFRDVPAGLGGHGLVKLKGNEVDKVLERGARWAVAEGYGWPQDLEVIETGGALPGANADAVSRHAKERGVAQLGTLGSGNHFLEVQVIDAVYDEATAAAFGITGIGQVVVFIHTGSRGLGHQTCDDYLRVMERAAQRYDIHLPDKQLACAPIRSPEGKGYLGAMYAAANFAFANRQLITHWVRQAFARILGRSAEELGMNVVYDVAHNIAKLERYRIDGQEIELCIHRKGATRAFPARHPEIPSKYRHVGQPVLVPGDMGRYSFLCVGTQRAMAETWGSTCHGAGRIRSRGEAKRVLRGVDIARRLAEQEIVVRAQNKAALAEEASEAYKDVADVVEVLDQAGISRKVARMRPIGVMKG